MTATTINIDPVDVRSEAFADVMAEYPYPSEVDSLDELPRVVCVASDKGEPFTAQVIGYGSSYRANSHINHDPGTPLEKGERCSGCRWTDTAILRVKTGVEWSAEAGKYMEVAPPQYVLVTLGKTIVPGEQQREMIVWTMDAAEVLRKLFVPTKKHFQRDTAGKSIPPHNAVAFRDAACVDSAFAELLARYETVIPEIGERGVEADPLAGL